MIGAWKLASYVEKPVDGSPTTYPLGENPKGLILYTPDGYMSAQLMAPDRAPFASGDWFDGTTDEYRQEASTYIAYSGAYYVDEDKQALFHSMHVSLFPNWTGQTQQRIVSLEGNVLHLSSAESIMSGGQEVMSYLEWRRAKASS
ncbi:lipocalin-like domain-containing protein [Salinisphaera sp.]|uniref:lipocalin-like domain-containing protein n=1 Tax=Salinisphaera sp. TaxID=1914330 RepID=UPI002D78A610|nr:lipocalin-like domain-containing protein [Salinisphaera sp.]HET7314695.1 lipocalin-like domain-containing protein [Salinisphaera sp.]